MTRLSASPPVAVGSRVKSQMQSFPLCTASLIVFEYRLRLATPSMTKSVLPVTGAVSQRWTW